MRQAIGSILITLLSAVALHAQDRSIFFPSFGVEAGVPITNMFSSYPITALDYPVTYTPFSTAVPRYEVGVYAKFHLTRHWAFEVEGQFRRGGFSFEQPLNQFYEHTVFSNWEFPWLFEYNFTHGRVRPFVNVGSSLRHISGVRTTFAYPGVSSTENTSDIFRNSGSWGGVAGVGLTTKAGPLELSPELRYTRWWNADFPSLGLTNSRNEIVFLLGLGF